jgi:hypothetical protein
MSENGTGGHWLILKVFSLLGHHLVRAQPEVPLALRTINLPVIFLPTLQAGVSEGFSLLGPPFF